VVKKFREKGMTGQSEDWGILSWRGYRGSERRESKEEWRLRASLWSSRGYRSSERRVKKGGMETEGFSSGEGIGVQRLGKKRTEWRPRYS
jgi:hypothetical protein